MQIVRNTVLCLGLAVLAYVFTWFFNIELIEALVPALVPGASKVVFAVAVLLSVGVLLTSFLLALLVQSPRPWLWVFGYATFWFLLALFPNLGWRVHSQHGSSLVLGAVAVWPAVLVFCCALLGARVAVPVAKKLRHASAKGAA